MGSVIAMPLRRTVLRLYLHDDRQIDLDRAVLVVDRLAARRRVEGGSIEWRVSYEVADPSAAMEMCARDLDDLDPRGIEYFDFSVLRPFGHARGLSGSDT
jgi:hypothetical protein